MNDHAFLCGVTILIVGVLAYAGLRWHWAYTEYRDGYNNEKH